MTIAIQRRRNLNAELILSRSRKGFTLLELLVAITILSLLLVLLLGMVDAATRLWRVNENRVDAYREARAAINLLANDLSSIQPSTNLFHFSSQEDSDLPSISGAASEPHMDGKLFFLTALPPQAQGSGNKGDLCIVGYFLGYDKTSLTGKGTASYNLYRVFVGSNATFTALKTGKPFAGMNVETAPTSNNTEVLAKNITNFEVTPLTIDPANPQTPTEFRKTAATPLPDIVEVQMTAVSNDASKRLINKADWETKSNSKLKTDERTFTIRIHLPAAEAVKASALPSPTPSPTP